MRPSERSVWPAPPHPAPAVAGDLGLAHTRSVLSWVFPEPRASLSSAPVGGGSAALDWLVNVGVGDRYLRTDLERHATEVVERLGLRGTGAALFTAVDVAEFVRTVDGGVAADATVGVTTPTWAADADGPESSTEGQASGTINLVVQLPVALSPAAAVNAVITATEAKAQALLEAGVPGTGTASDAVVVCWPPSVPAERFAGPRSTWGARIARAVHAAVAAGLATEGTGR